jgi:hypothetical protein
MLDTFVFMSGLFRGDIDIAVWVKKEYSTLFKCKDKSFIESQLLPFIVHI